MTGMSQDEPADVLESWPDCPQCHRPRQAKCPLCGTSGTHFPNADRSPSTDDDAPVERWICPTCDEPLSDLFERYCAGCHHDFGEKRQAPAEPQREGIHPLWLASLVALAFLVAYALRKIVLGY